MVQQRRTVSVLIQGQNQTGPAFKQAMQQANALEKEIANLNSTMRFASGQFGLFGQAARTVPAIMGAAASAIGAVTGAMIAATTAAVGLAVAGAGLSNVIGLQLVSEMEQTEVKFKSIFKDMNLVEEAMRKLRKEADTTPFTFAEMTQAASMLGTAAKQADMTLMDLVETAEILGALRPDQGIVGAAFALREAASGDFTSIVERFDLPRQRLNQLKKEGVPGIQAVQTVMKELGHDLSLVDDMSKTLTGRWSTFMDLLDGFRVKMAQSPFKALKDGLEVLSNIFERNREIIEIYATKAGDLIAGFITRAVTKIDELSVHIPTLLMAFENLYVTARAIWHALADTVWEAAQSVYEAFSYMNPFARHSPSLVESVQEGVAAIASYFQTLPEAVAGPIQSLYEGFQQVNEIVGKGLTSPKQVTALEGAFKSQETAIRMAEMALIPYERALKRAQEGVALLSKELQAAENALRYFQSAPLQGERAFEDALFNNSQAMARLRLEQMAMEEAGPGKTVSSKRQYATRRKQTEMQMARLRREAEKTSLVKQLTIDPQRRALQQIGQQTEISFREAATGAQNALAAMTRIQPALASAQAEAAVMEENLAGQRDRLQEQRDLLEQIKLQYGGIIDQIKAAEAERKKKEKDGGLPPIPEGPPRIGGPSAGTGRGFQEPPGAYQEVRPNPAMNEFLNTLNGIKNVIGFVTDGVKTFFAALRGDWEPGEGIATFHDVLGRIGLAAHAAAPHIKYFFDEVLVPGVKGAVVLVDQLLKGDLMGAFKTVETGVINLSNMLKPHLDALAKQLGQWITDGAKYTKDNWQTWVRTLLGFVGDAAPDLATKFIAEWVPQIIAGFVGMTVEFGSWWVREGNFLFLKLGLQLAAGIIKGILLGLVNLSIILTNAIIEAIQKIDISAGPIRIKGSEWGLQKIEELKVDPGTGDVTGGRREGTPNTPPQQNPSSIPTQPRRGEPPAKGYATGGSFIVGGMGGTDSQMVRFMATPGERVIIQPPGQQGGGTTVPVSITINATVRSDSDLDDLRRAVQDLPRRINEQLVKDWDATVGRGRRAPLGLSRSTV